jgi:NitT/TauT family transport system substrate-binding protein
MRKIFLVLVVLLMSIGTLRAQDAALRDLTFFMTFIPNIQFAPVYLGIANGYFGEAGLNIQIEHGFDEAVGLERIATGDLTVGIISGEQVILARAQGRPVKYVYGWFQQYPVGIVTRDGVTSITELRGQRVGIPAASGASYSGLIALLSANGITLNDIQLEVIGFNAPDVFCTGGVAASVIYVNNEPLEIARRAAAGQCGDVSAVQVFPVSDVANLVSNGLVTSDATLAADPATVYGVVSGFHRGLRDVIANPAQAYLVSADYVEGLLTDETLRLALLVEAETQALWLNNQEEPITREALNARHSEMRARLGETFDAQTLAQMDVLLSTIPLWQAQTLGVNAPEAWDAMQTTLLSTTDPNSGQPILAAPTDLLVLYDYSLAIQAECDTPAPLLYTCATAPAATPAG